MVDGECQEGNRGRGAVYVDGFNLYHPIHESNQQHLKWASLWRLGEILCEAENLDLVKVVFCTAVPKHKPDSYDRHIRFNAAQIACGVTVLKGHHVRDGDTDKYSEKQSDINVALSLMLDGLDDVYDVAFMISADSDQVATGNFFKERLAPHGKRMLAVIPFTKTYPSNYVGLGIDRRSVTIDMLERCLMPAEVRGKSGHPIHRPEPYAPPEGWIHPDERPKGRPPRPPKRAEWSRSFKAAR